MKNFYDKKTIDEVVKQFNLKFSVGGRSQGKTNRVYEIGFSVGFISALKEMYKFNRELLSHLQNILNSDRCLDPYLALNLISTICDELKAIEIIANEYGKDIDFEGDYDE